MKLIIDTSVIIAVLVNEPIKRKLIELTKGAELIAPLSVHWEIGNAFSAMLKRKKTDIAKVIKAIQIYDSISITMVDIELEEALLIADKLNIYAYDAYLIACALKNHCPLVSLDNGLVTAAKNFGVKILEIES
ncbi:MAG: PIN domain-containing protein [Gammaproteobacteria bacterium]|nr:MAG: PIN domain-containing protein [Gammaproteobacteria bacterium]